MSDYKRLFSYLYFYQRKIKEKNSGFVKVEIRNNQCRLQLSVKGGFLNQTPRWDVYGFMRRGQELCLWRLGRMSTGNGQGEWAVQMPLARFLGEAADLSHVAGLLLYGSRNAEVQEQLPDMENSETGLVCATVWDDFPLFVSGEAPKEILHAAQVDAPEDQECPEPEQSGRESSGPKWSEQERPEQKPEVGMLTGEEVLSPVDGECARTENESAVEAKTEREKGPGAGESRLEEGESPQAEGIKPPCDTREEWDTLRELLEEKEVEKIMADRTVSPEPQPAPTPLFGPPRQHFIPPESCRKDAGEPRQEQPETGQKQAGPIGESWQESSESRRQQSGKENPLCQPEPQTGVEPGWEPGPGAGCPCPDQCIWSDMYQEPPKSLWEKLASFYPKLILNGLSNDWEILKIMPRDIGRLPRENWVYGNNSFLLHGYYRHHHLILACYRGTTPPQYYLGVPGSCSDRERVMASMFGFTNYLPGGKRGYWYTPINLGNN